MSLVGLMWMRETLASWTSSVRCPNPYCRDGWVQRGDNESGGAPPFPCQVCKTRL